MNNISDEVISVEEAETALRCMRLCNLDEYEALECVGDLVERVRRLSMAKLVERVIETKLTENQRIIVQEFWFSGKNTVQIAREMNVSQANVYRILTRANNSLKELLEPLIMYFNDLPSVQVVPLILEETMKICSAQHLHTDNLPSLLQKIRISKAVTPECAARAMCITAGELKKIESGHKGVTVDYLSRFSQVFSVDIDFNFVKGKVKYEWKEVLNN
ncbi:MAG: hypothetical protein IKT61_04225 [Clostridia bacterium]|nr:hypothetical protein [Clostridia bacterium]